MKKEEFCDILGQIDDRYIQEAEESRRAGHPGWYRWGSLAACLCLAGALAAGWLGKAPAPPDVPPALTDSTIGEEQTEGTGDAWQAVFNSALGALDRAKRDIPGYFTQMLTEGELAALYPGAAEGYAGFDGEGKLVEVVLTVPTADLEETVSVTISREGGLRDYYVSREPVISRCGDVEYRAYRWTVNGNLKLTAEGTVKGHACSFSMDTAGRDPEGAAAEFSRVLEEFASAPLDLTAITAREIPEWFDRAITHEEALEDGSYGAYFLADIPAGYTVESIRRYKDQHSDYLSGLWTRGYDELRWKVYTMRKTDEIRLTGVEERENYDLSLYPIPRAASVPEALWEVVDNPIFDAGELTADVVWARAYQVSDAGDSDGWRMAFSVRYGDTVVEVRTKGVDPQWVYEQLMLLK